MASISGLWKEVVLFPDMPAGCREQAARRFTSAVMAARSTDLYEQLISGFLPRAAGTLSLIVPDRVPGVILAGRLLSALHRDPCGAHRQVCSLARQQRGVPAA
jgi:hypothetical protein